MRGSSGTFACLLTLVTVGSVAGSGCGGKPPPPPAPPPPAEAAVCRRIGPYAEPLIEGWKTDARADLEAAMKDGVAVVAYDCHGLKVVKGCKLPGVYAYSGISRREELVQLTTADELRANLPLSADKLIEGYKDGSSVDIATITIGKRTTPRELATKADLAGTCEGATHYMRSAHIGGIATGIGKADKARTVIEIFAAATGAASTDEHKEGEYDPCRKATADISTPPQLCSTAIRLELVAIAPEGSEQKAFDDAVPRPQPCPEGMVIGAGKCALPEKQKMFMCAPTDAKECGEQCARGDAESCYRLGLSIKNGAGAGKGGRKARETFEKASSMGGSPRADFELGVALLRDKDKDQVAAEKLFTKACEAGDAWVCGTIGGYFDQGTLGTKSGTRAVENYRRGCNLGNALACTELATLWLEGRGVSSDVAGAVDILTRACSAGSARGCGVLGTLYAKGSGVEKDVRKAKELLEKGCASAQPDAETCAVLGNLQEGEKDLDKASASYEKACKGKDVNACARLGAILEKTSKPKAKEHYLEVCARLKDKRSCDRAKKMR